MYAPIEFYGQKPLGKKTTYRGFLEYGEYQTGTEGEIPSQLSRRQRRPSWVSVKKNNQKAQAKKGVKD